VETASVVPGERIPALGATPAFFLLLGPVVNTYFFKPAKVFQNLGMVLHTIIIEIRDTRTGKVGTIGAAGHPEL
jgi:hypothetical protein